LAASAPALGRVKNRTGRLNSPTPGGLPGRYASKSSYPAIQRFIDGARCSLACSPSAAHRSGRILEITALDFRDRLRSHGGAAKKISEASTTIERSGIATRRNHSLILRVDHGCLLAEYMDGRDLLVDSLAGWTSSPGLPSGFLRHIPSAVGACYAAP
jgi:hypothetical protein